MSRISRLLLLSDSTTVMWAVGWLCFFSPIHEGGKAALGAGAALWGRPMTRQPARAFIAPAARAGNGHGLLTQPLRQLPAVADEPHVLAAIRAANAICDEPECVSAAILDSYGADARYYQSVRYAAVIADAQVTRRLLTAEDRLRDAQRRARQTHRTDLRGEFLALEKAVQRTKRSVAPRLVTRDDGYMQSEPVTTAPASLLERLERVEAALDRAPRLGQAA